VPAEVRALRHKQLELSAAHFHTVAFDRAAGKLFAWGYPDSGLLGLGADIKGGDGMHHGTGHRWLMETTPRELHIFDDPTAQNPTAGDDPVQPESDHGEDDGGVSSSESEAETDHEDDEDDEDDEAAQ